MAVTIVYNISLDFSRDWVGEWYY